MKHLKNPEIRPQSPTPPISSQISKLTEQYEKMQIMFLQQQQIVNMFMTKMEDETDVSKKRILTSIKDPFSTPESNKDLVPYENATGQLMSTIDQSSPPTDPLPNITPRSEEIALKKILFPTKDSNKRTNKEIQEVEQLPASTIPTHQNKRHDVKSTPPPPPRPKPPDQSGVSSQSTETISVKPKPILIKNPYTKRITQKVPARAGIMKNE